MAEEKQHIDEKSRYEKMCTLLSTVFMSIGVDGISACPKKEVEEDLESWNKHYIEGITLTDLEDLLWEVAVCMFGVGQAVDKLLKTKWDSEDSDRTHWDEFMGRFEELNIECNHTLDGSKKILRDMGYNEREIEEIFEWFELNGGYCDCEVHLNVILREEEHWRF